MTGNFSGSVSLSPIVLDILHQRGIRDYKKVCEFLKPDISCLSDPFSITQMRRACEIIEKTIHEKKGIFLYADGDVDGISGVAIFSRVLESMGVHFGIKLTHRLEEYEIEPTFIDRIKHLGYNLLVTVDTGTTSVKLIEYCEKSKFHLIIVDHHRGQTRDDLKYVTIVNPSLDRGDGEFDFLTASGLVLKLVQTFKEMFPFFPEEIFAACIELAAIGTLGDYGFLIGDNRVIVKMGLEFLENTRIPGIEAFRKYFYVPKKANDIEPVTHYLNPKLNTPGRFGRPELAFKILTAAVNENIHDIFEEIDLLEKEKRNVLRKMSNTITMTNFDSPPFLIFEGIPVSFSGTFAARVSEKFKLPSLVAIKKKDIIQGSARGFDRADLYKFFENYRDIFISFGGHRNAVGFKMKDHYLKDLKDTWKKLKIHDTTAECLSQPMTVDLDRLTVPVMEELQLLKPFGPGNQPVIFKSFPVECLRITRYEAGRVVSWIRQGSKMFEARFPKGFRMPSRLLSISYCPVLKKSGNLYLIWLDIKNYSETF